MAWGQPEPRIAFGQESDSCISLGMQCNEHTRNAAASSARWVPDILSAALRNSVPDSEGFFNAGVDVYTTTLLAILLPLALAFVYRHKMNSQKVPFRFLDLPAELREMVYDNLLEEPSYHTHYQSDPSYSSTCPGRWHDSAFSISEDQDQKPQRKHSSWIFLANKQVYAEFMDVLVKKSTFHFSVSPPPSQPAQVGLLANPQQPSTAKPHEVTLSAHLPSWFIAPETLTRLRNCTLTLNVTSSMLGCSDPRRMPPDSWALARRIQRQLLLSPDSSIQSLSLHVKAISDPLWNPLWVWYHASQSFKAMDRLREIRFSLDIYKWSPGENHLKREASAPDETGEPRPWSWYCANDHLVGTEASSEVTVRQFCALIYQECYVCRPELDVSDEEEEA